MFSVTYRSHVVDAKHIAGADVAAQWGSQIFALADLETGSVDHSEEPETSP